MRPSSKSEWPLHRRERREEECQGWPDRGQIARAVLDVLKTNLGLKSGEKLE